MRQASGQEKLLQQYAGNATLRALIQLVLGAGGSAADVFLTTRLESIRKCRVRAFFDELAEGAVDLTPELLESEDFLHCFFATSSAAVRTRRQEKIRLFARLLKSCTRQDALSSIDEYEEYLGILDELSYRELRVLLLLDKYESQFPQGPDENEFQRSNRFWDQLRDELVRTIGIPENEIEAVLTRLSRSGCYQTFVGMYWDYEGGRGKLTPTYFRLRSLIQGQEPDLA